MADISISAYLNKFVDDELNNINEKKIRAQRETMKRVLGDTDEYVPYKTGNLAKTASILPSNDGVLYPAEYASYAFNPTANSGKAKEYNTSVHSKATGNPFEASYDDNGDAWAELFAEELLK